MRHRHFLKQLTGTASGHTYDPARLINLDPADGRPVEFTLDLTTLAAVYGPDQWLDRERLDMWRYGPLIWNCAGPHAHLHAFGEGWTPLIEDSSHPSAANRTIHVKDEGRPHPGYGCNPTGSFKDRGMAMVINQAMGHGLQKLAVPTQGNAGDSLAWYCSQVGLGAVIIMPEDTPAPIMGNVARLAHRYPKIQLELVQGTIREAGERMKERWLPQGYFNCATFQEPGWRIEGKKSLGLEIAEQLGWRFPDAIVYPTGGGTGVLGMAKAFRELQHLGVVGAGPLPRFYCVQSARTAPLVRAFDSGSEDSTPVEAGETLATGLNVPGGVGHKAVLAVIRASGGRALAIAEDLIAAALSHHWRRTGLWLCPEGAACYAALDQLIERDEIAEQETVVIVNTGSFEKYLPDLRHLL